VRILLIEDDKQLSKTLTYYLEQHHYEVDACLNGEDGWYYMQQKSADLIILDRMLPGLSGTELLRRLRARQDTIPVLLLTAMGTLRDKVNGLDAGADDYLVKPFAIEELMARIRSLLRRQTMTLMTGETGLTYGDLTYQEENCELTGPGGQCTLSRRENALFVTLIRNAGQVLGRSQLLDKVWGPAGEVEDGNLDNYIFFLRRRLKCVDSAVQIVTVRGVGYKME
jgi:DNA-binding response OmpR family regulator